MSICSLFARLFAHCSLNHFSANLNLDPRPPVASIDRIVAEAKALREIGIGTIAIMPNDTRTSRLWGVVLALFSDNKSPKW
jgi:hypothetical protein